MVYKRTIVITLAHLVVKKQRVTLAQVADKAIWYTKAKFDHSNPKGGLMKPTTTIVARTTAFFLFALGLPQATVAQGGDDPNARDTIALDEITVTARKREESLRDVPIAVSAVSPETIARAGITDVQELALISPGLSYREGFGRSTGNASNRPSIRGMSSILGSPNASFFVDGIYVDGPINAYSMENMQRTEVLRGPQAATFGRGTFAGAINFVTRRPGDEFMGRIKIDGSDHSMSDITAFASGPLIDDVLAAEINFRIYDRGEDPGYTNLSGNGDKIGEEHTDALGIKVLWTPNDSAEIYLNLNWTNVEDGTFAYGLWNGGDNADLSAISSNSPDTINCFALQPPAAFRFGFIPIQPTRTRGYYCGEIGTPDAFWNDTGGLKGVERDTMTAGLNADFQIGEVTLSSITGYTTYDYANNFSATYPGAVVAPEIGEGYETFSQEIRLSSSQEGAVHWTIGAYLFNREAGTDISGSSFNPQTESASSVEFTTFDNDSKTENRAIFAGIDWEVTDTLKVFAELRSQEEEITLSGRNVDTGTEQFEGSPSVEFSATLPRIGFSWAASGDFNIYGNIAEGNSPGDFNEPFYDVQYDAANRAQWVGTRGTYDESDVRTYELGLKGTFFDGRMSANVAAYVSDWEKQALTQTDALTRAGSTAQATIPYIVNAGESEVKGIEIEILARPTENWDLGLSYALSDAKFKDYIDENWADLQDTNGIYTGNDYTGAFIVDSVDDDGQVAGNALPQTPRHMASFTSTLHFPMANDAETFVRVDYNYESKRYVQAANLAWIGASHNVNLRAGYAKDNWEVSLWAKNLTDDDTPEVVTRLLDFRSFFYIPSQDRPPPFDYPTSGLRFNFPRDFTVTAPRTREVGATLTFNF